MVSRKPSLHNHPSFTTSFTTAALLPTPIEENPPNLTHSTSTSNLTSYFTLHRAPSHSRRPSLSTTTPTATTPSSPTNQMNAVTTLPYVPPPSPNLSLHTLLDTSHKRIQTLSYLQRTHSGKTFWFNTYCLPLHQLFPSPPGDAHLPPHLSDPKLLKRARNFFILGHSLPGILSIQTLPDFLAGWHKLLSEYETYISLPPSRRNREGSISSSYSAPHHAHVPTTPGPTAGTKLKTLFSRRQGSRRGSTASGASIPMPPGAGANNPGGVISLPTLPDDGVLSLSASGGMATPGIPAMPALANTGEEWIYLQTLLPGWEVDYFEVFVGLCGVLEEVYVKLREMVKEREEGGGIGGMGVLGMKEVELFGKCDGKVRRLVVGGVVREWEDAVRGGVKREVGGVGREVLMGMM